VKNILLLALILTGCGWFKGKPSHGDPSKTDQVKQKTVLYLELEKSQTDSDGFIQFDQCDSLLFSGLVGIATEVNILAARDVNGKWHRRSLQHPECYTGGSSSSTISRDMFIGLLWYVWRNKDLQTAEELFDYGKDHDWIMGEGDPARIYFTPGLQATLAEIIYRLGGKNHLVYRNIPQVTAKNTDFAAHLDMLHILLRSELTGGVNASEKEIIKYNYERVPGNALFSFIYHKFEDGNQNETLDNLLNQSVFPADRLPTSADRCEPWIYQRDLGHNWQPCNDGHTHSGGDLIFVSKLLFGNLM